MHSRRRNAPSRTRAHALNERAHVRSAGARRHEPARRLASFSVAHEPTASKACSQRCARACAPGSLRKRVHSAGPRRIIRWRHLQEFVALGKARAEGLHAGAPRAASSARSHGPPRHAMHSCPSRLVHGGRTGARAREALLGGASPAARPAAGRRGCTCGRAGAARACAATRALRERRRSSSSARTASAAPARQESSQSPVCTSACMRE
jgi:hypothetical protein